MTRRTRLVYGALVAAWVLVLAWQTVEHLRVRQSARTEIGTRAKDISNTLGVVLGSQRRYGVIPKERVESALNSLIRPGELNAIALLNNADEIVAAAGTPINAALTRLAPRAEHWGLDTVVMINLVDLGTNFMAEPDHSNPLIILPRSPERPGGTNRPPGQPGPPPEGGRMGQTPPGGGLTNAPPPGRDGTNSPPPSRSRGFRGRGGDRPPPGRPFWMDEAEYQSLLQKQGAHSFVLVLSTDSLRNATRRDLWIRTIIVLLASLSVVGLGLAWGNMTKSSELELRLVRAAELNARLKEMNLAAAGLAHETRNPLNIIRGLAQMISRKEDAGDDIRTRSRDIIDETDRVTAQLSEFINFSRPREVRRTTVLLGSAVSEVVRALGTDIEEKAIRLQVAPELPTIEADEQLLRQALFNLLINAVQAVPPGGTIEVVAEKTSPAEARLDIRDNGPGVAPENRSEVFKPYFTTNAKGTGLGLAVVHQIVLAHGWEVACLPNQPQGAIFRLNHLKLAQKT